MHLIDETRQAIPELPFRRMRGMRNIVAHDYANVDIKIVWEVATVHVPDDRVNVLLRKLEAYRDFNPEAPRGRENRKLAESIANINTQDTTGYSARFSPGL